MTRLTILASAIALACYSAGLFAATVIESKDTQGNIARITLESGKVRMDMPNNNAGYMLMLLEEDKRYSINHKQKMILDASQPPSMPEMQKMPAPAEAEKVQAELKSIGEGPQMAGYPTTHYQILANGQVCSDEYISANTLQLPEIKNFIAKQKKAEQPPHPFMPQNPCMKASFEVAEQIKAIGLVMKSEVNGKVRQEIVSIQTNVQVAPEQFTLPQDYQTITVQEMMRKMMSQQPPGAAHPEGAAQGGANHPGQAPAHPFGGHQAPPAPPQAAPHQ